MSTSPTIPYSRRDYTAIEEALLALQIAEAPEITDVNHSAFNRVLNRLVASTGDALHGNIDRAVAELFVEFALFLRSLIEQGRTVGYVPTLSAAATTRLELTRVEGSDAISVPRHTAFGRSDGLEYLTAEDCVIQAGEASVQVNALQGIRAEQSFEVSEFNDEADMTKRPRVSLGSGVAAGTVEVWQGDPAQYWTLVEEFFESWQEDRHYICLLNGDTLDVALVLGDGVQGQGPSDTMHARFVRTAGAAGNCGHSVITSVPDEFEGILTCTNIEPATGGAGPETREQARRRIPAVTATQRRAVTGPDYEALIGKLPGVLHVQAVDVSSNLYYLDLVERHLRMPFEYVVLVVVPAGGGQMSTLLRDQILAECSERGGLGPWSGRYLLEDATVVPVNVAIRIGVQPGYDPQAVIAAVHGAVTELLNVENQELAGTLRFSDLHATVSAVAGVSWAEFDAPREDVRAGDGEILVVGTVAVVVG